MLTDNYLEGFLALVRAGLWERNVALTHLGTMDFSAIMRLADEQSVVGLVTAGLEYVTDVKVPQEWALEFASMTLQMEQSNKEMNLFVAKLVVALHNVGIYAVLVKGQGIAQSYEKPLWRANGDVDLYLTKENYERAKKYLSRKAQSIEKENPTKLHLGMTIDGWLVELHGTMHTSLSRLMNIMSDEVQENIFNKGCVRSWNNNGVDVFLPAPNEDVIVIFNHFVNHFFLGGVGLRQICDWCRLLWIFKDSLNHALLESRIRKMRLMTEWRAFATLAVEYLGMPYKAMPLLTFRDESLEFRDRFKDKEYKKNKRKADRIMSFVLESGNFGHNRDVSYRANRSTYMVNIITLWRRICDFSRFSRIFPLDSPMFFARYLVNRMIIIKDYTI